MPVVAGANAHAQGFFDDGDTLNYTCREEKGSFARGACLGTVSGALDMMRALGYVCKLEGVTREQAKDAVLKYLADHPERRKWQRCSRSSQQWKLHSIAKLPLLYSPAKGGAEPYGTSL